MVNNAITCVQKNWRMMQPHKPETRITKQMEFYDFFPNSES